MSCPYISLVVESGEQPTTVVECCEKTLYAEYRLNQSRKGKAAVSGSRRKKRRKNIGDANETPSQKSGKRINKCSKKKAKFTNMRNNKF